MIFVIHSINNITFGQVDIDFASLALVLSTSD